LTMATLLAPYHNGMRLGQGFNSYTQQIGLDNAVLPDTPKNRDRVRVYYVPDEYKNQTGDNFLAKTTETEPLAHIEPGWSQ
jgi:hypothetical protein